MTLPLLNKLKSCTYRLYLFHFYYGLWTAFKECSDHESHLVTSKPIYLDVTVCSGARAFILCPLNEKRHIQNDPQNIHITRFNTKKPHLESKAHQYKHLSFYYLSNYIVSHGKVALGCGVGVIQFKTRFPYGHHRHKMEIWRKKKM